VPVNLFLHWDIEQVNEHQLAEQSGVGSRLIVNLANLNHQVLRNSRLKLSIELVTLLIRSSNSERMNSTSLSVINIKRLKVRCLFVDNLKKCF